MPPDGLPSLPESLLSMVETISPVFEAGRGIRERLLAEGWSPTAAESLAMQAMNLMFSLMGRAMKGQTS